MSDKTEENMTVAEVMDALADSESISIPMLYQLSDLQGEDLPLFQEKWGMLETERRREVMRHLADLIESNYLLQFNSVFRLGIEDKHAPVRLAAVEGLWFSVDVRAIQPLIDEMAGDNEVEVRAAAAATLGQYLLHATCKFIPERYEEVIMPALITQLQTPYTPSPVFCRALEAASQAGDPALNPHIYTAYESDDQEFQISAVRAMGEIGEEHWLPVILDEMESDNVDMRVAAATAAGSLENEDAISELVELTDDRELVVRVAAIYALGNIGGDIVSRVLKSIRNDDERAVLHEAVDETIEEMSDFII